MTPDQLRVADRITAYLSGGGLFNPELANHDAVRDLLIDARDAHAAALEEIERLREAGMREAATDARLIDWLEKALFAKSWNAVIDSGSRTHWRIVEGHRHITAKMEGATFRDAILSAIGGGK